MGEALIFRAGTGGDSGGGYQFVSSIYTSNSTFTMPAGVKNNQVYVRIFGGGGGGQAHTDDSGYMKKSVGGCGGYMNNGWVTLNAGELVPITIGKGGVPVSSGTTSFGIYLAASGANSWVVQTAAETGAIGSSGGGIYSRNGSTVSWSPVKGSTANQFGGGGVYASSNYFNIGTHGQWGGAGGTKNSYASDGINTVEIISESDQINADGIGYGKAGSGYAAGGGGYGANGGNGPAGGGGGYGKAGYGGDGMNLGTWNYMFSAGGGGGYGAGGQWNRAAGYGAGGAGTNYTNGGNGICIVQYFQKV